MRAAAPTASIGQGLGRHEKLHRSSEYHRVGREGRRMALPSFRVLMAPPEPGQAAERRLGVTVSRKVANAVGRNRVKRLVREFFRRNKADWPAGDAVVIALTGAAELDYESVRRQLGRVLVGPAAKG